MEKGRTGVLAQGSVGSAVGEVEAGNGLAGAVDERADEIGGFGEQLEQIAGQHRVCIQPRAVVPLHLCETGLRGWKNRANLVTYGSLHTPTEDQDSDMGTRW